MKLVNCLLALILMLSYPVFAAETAKETGFDRIMRTNTIRCGYIIYPPFFSKDVNSGAYSGIIYDVMEKVGAKLGLKIDWTEEVFWASMFEGLKTGRYDMLCVDGWDIAINARYVRQAKPLFYSQINAFTRADVERFDNNLAAINADDVTISGIDGTLPSIIANERFPKAKKLDMPQNTDYSTVLLNVASGKADVTFAENAVAIQFMTKNPGKIRMVKLPRPIQYYSNSLLVPIGDTNLQAMIDIALSELLGSGFIDEIVDRYDTKPPTFLHLAKPYATHP